MREVVLDIETTGLDPLSGHRIVEIGCVEVMNYVPTGRYYHAYVNPEREVPEDAGKVHGLSTEFLADKDVRSGLPECRTRFCRVAAAVARRFEIDNTNRTLHGALLDAQLLAECYLELMGGRQANLELGNQGQETIVAAPRVRPVRPPRPHAPSAEELAAHSAMLALIRNPLWRQ
jgi:DNA polymerase-3 subunit epsilon